MNLSASEAETRGVRVSVESEFVEERSKPDQQVWLYAYHVHIANESSETVQLVSRHWVITSGTGVVEEVRGPGVVGKQPVLAPGEAFEYSSFCSLRTPFGIMHGSYEMTTELGERFDAEIAPFQLGEPETVH